MARFLGHLARGVEVEPAVYSTRLNLQCDPNGERKREG